MSYRKDKPFFIGQKIDCPRLLRKLRKLYVKEHAAKNQSVGRILLKCFGWSYFTAVLWVLSLKAMIIFLLPFTVKEIVKAFRKDSTKTDEKIMQDVFSFLFGYLLKVILESFGPLWNDRYALKMKTALRCLIYEKILTLDVPDLDENVKKDVVTLMNEDVSALDKFLNSMNNLFGGIFHVLLVYHYLNGVFDYHIYVVYVTFSIIIGVVVMQGLIGVVMYLIKLKSNSNSSKYLQMSREILTNINFIKANNWETYFSTKLGEITRKEGNLWKYFLFMFSEILGFIGSPGSFFVLLLLYASAQKLSGHIVYYLLCTYLTFSFNISKHVMDGLESIRLLKKMTRKANFILFKTTEATQPVHEPADSPVVHLENISDNATLKNFTFKAQRGINLIIGPAGWGKTNLAEIIMGERSAAEGRVEVSGSISYASQNPVLFPCSIQDNVQCHEPKENSRFILISSITGMTSEIEPLAELVTTSVTDNGSNLTHSLRAKINLGRALYRSCDIYVLDDCLATVDDSSRESIFKKIAGDYFKDKICIYLTNDPRLIKYADNVVIVKDGVDTFSGKSSYISTHDTVMLKDEFNKYKEKYASIANEQEIVQVFDGAPADGGQSEIRRLMNLFKKLYTRFVKPGGIVYLGLFSVAVLLYYVNSSCLQYILKCWVDLLENGELMGPKQQNMDQQGHINSIDIYNPFQINLENKWIILYTMFAMTMFILHLLGLVFIAPFMIRFCAKSRHIILKNLIGFKMNFFKNYSVDSILNKLIKDIKFIDEEMVFIIYQSKKLIFSALTNVILILLVDPIIGLSLIVFIPAIYLTNKYFMKTARKLQILDSRHNYLTNARYVRASLDALTTIRSFKMQEILKNEFENRQLWSTYASQYGGIGPTSNFVLIATASHVFLGFIFIKCVLWRSVTSLATAGLLIVQGMELCQAIEEFTKLLIGFGNRTEYVERILEYTEAKKEITGVAQKDWPSEGSISFCNVSFKYNSRGSYVLNGVTLNLKANEKLLILGFPHSGKTSLLRLMLNMFNFSGDIIIDEVSIKNISVDVLRKSITFVPQEVACFSGTVKENLDPLSQCSDAELWKALKNVKLDTFITSLDDDLSSCKLSLSQKRLFTLARAFLKDSKIVIIDDLSVTKEDVETNDIIKLATKKLIQNRTAIVVSNDPSSVPNYDKVLMLDEGKNFYYGAADQLIWETL